MVYATGTQAGSIFKSVKANKIIEGEPTNTFLGHLDALGSNILNYAPGELLYNKNCEWRFSGNSKILRTKRGSTLFKDITLASKGYGVFYKDSTNYMIWVDTAGNLKSYTDGGSITTLTTGLDTTYRHEFWYYGLASNETLYGSNRTDGLYKITMPVATLTYASVLSSIGVWSMSYSKISGRLIITNGHKAYYSKVQNQTAPTTANLEDFDTTNRWLWVTPDQGDGIQRITENGNITFYYKDTGIWALLNADEEIANWLQPQCNADVGTKSPETIAYVKYGQSEVFLYLGSDKTLRLFTAAVTRNSGAIPTLDGGDSIVISKPFQRLLLDIPDGQLSKCTGFYFDNYYILNFVSSGGAEIDSTIIVNLNMLSQAQGDDDVAQPYWFYTENMEFTHYAIVDNQKLYGIHKNGYIAQLFVNDKYYEETPHRVTTTQDFRDYLVITGTSGTFKKNESLNVSWASKDSNRDWYAVSMSADGSIQAAIVFGGKIYISIDFGDSWTAYDSDRDWTGISMSDDGSVMSACVNTGKIYISTDVGQTWTAKDSVRNWSGIAVSGTDGTKQTATVFGGKIYISANSGATWTAKDSTRDWAGVVISADGSQQTAVVDTKQLYVSSDTGATWTAVDSERVWSGLAMSADGTKQSATVYDGQIYISIDSGSTWAAQDVARNWSGIDLSDDGVIQYAIEYSGNVYVSTDSGSTWVSQEVAKDWAGIALSSDGAIGLAIVSESTIFTKTSSAASAKITLEFSSTNLLVKDTSGVFVAGDVVTGGTSGATATITSIVRRVAIEWAAYTGWRKYSNKELRLYDAYLNWEVDGRWNINFSVNSFVFGETIPQYDEGASFTMKPQNVGGSYFDYDYFNVAYFSSNSGQLSQNSGGQGRGHYFSFGFKNSNYNEWATMYSIDPRFEVIKNGPMGRN